MPTHKRSNARQSTYRSIYVNPLSELKQSSKAVRSNPLCSANNLNLQICRGASTAVRSPNNIQESLYRSSYSSSISMDRRALKSCKKLQTLLSRNAKPNINTDSNDNTTRYTNNNVCEGRTSLRVCIQLNEPDSKLGALILGTPATRNIVWDDSETEAAPAPSWSTIPNRSLLCRPLPPDIGRCTCYIIRERSERPDNASVYSLYTNEGQGRQDRKLAVARHKRRNGRSEFMIGQSGLGLCKSEEGYVGMITANLVGSKYHIWDQGSRLDTRGRDSKLLLGVVTFVPTVTTLTGSFRSMRVCIPKQQSMQVKNTSQVCHTIGLPRDWEENMCRVQKLCSKAPSYNKGCKRYELDFRERVKSGLKIRTSVKNFQLTMEENGKQNILLLGKLGKSKYVMEYRFPLTAYQAFCICLASIDSKLCCSV